MSVAVKVLLGIAVAVALIVFGVRWYDGNIAAARADGATAERAVWVAKDRDREAAEKVAVLKQAQDALAQRAAQAAVSFQVEANHAKALQDLKTRNAALITESRAAGGLRVSRALCNGDGGPLLAGSKADGADGLASYLAGTVALPDDTQRRLRTLASDADEVVEDFRAVQAWATLNGYVPAPLN
jgi:hypothetical protein